MKTLGSRLAALTAAIFVTLGLVAGAPAEAATIDQQKVLLERELADVNFFWTMYNNRYVEPYDDFDYSTDLCSWSPDRPLGFDFRNACRRHDFNYRNYKRLDIFTEPKRLQIDDAFRTDMYAKCATYSWWVRGTCRGTANTYYYAVRNFGAS